MASLAEQGSSTPGDLRRSRLLQAALAMTAVLSALALWTLAWPVYQSGLLLRSRRWLAATGLGGAAVLVLAALLALAFSSRRELLLRLAGRTLAALGRLKAFNLVLFALGIALFSAALLLRYGRYLEALPLRLALFWPLALVGSLLLWAAGLRRSPGQLLAAATLLSAAGYKAAAFLPDISAYPFTLYWSEASRYYYASLYLAEKVYGAAAHPTVLHPSRYLLQAVPFLISGSPIWLHRLWQVMLWIGMTALASALLARRLELPERLARWTMAAYAFLFLLVGPVYYHLQVPLILVLWGFRRDRFWRSLLAVVAASAWAGISRVNWYPVPAMLAISLYLLEEPAAGRPLWRYLLAPAAWAAAGLAAAAGAQAAYIAWSGNAAEQFASSFTSDLLWYRLWPNPTYPLGILPSVLLVSLPLVLLAAWRVRGPRRQYHWIRHLGLAAMLLVLLAGGLVVSVKIGGGSNLHNLDAYLALLLVVCAYVYWGRYASEPALEDAAPDRGVDANPARPAWATAALALAVLLPVYFTLTLGAPGLAWDRQKTQDTLDRLAKFTGQAAGQGEVLFLAERQLLTFHNLSGIRLVPEYERVFMMEMAMAGNPDYLGKLHADLQSHRFAMIVSEPLFVQSKGSAEIWGEENDAWVQNVSRYVLCYYEPVKLFRDVHIQLLQPRAEPGDCP